MHLLPVHLVLGDIRKIKWCGIAIKYLGMTVLSLLQNFSNILHIYSYFCTSMQQHSHQMFSSQARSIPQATNLPEVTIYKCKSTFTMQSGWHIKC